MAVLVDSPRTERFDEPTTPSHPIIILDADGNEIIHIDEELDATDLRIDATRLDASSASTAGSDDSYVWSPT